MIRKAQAEPSGLTYSLHIWAPVFHSAFSTFIWVVCLFVVVVPVNHLESYVQYHVQNFFKNLLKYFFFN